MKFICIAVCLFTIYQAVYSRPDRTLVSSGSTATIGRAVTSGVPKPKIETQPIVDTTSCGYARQRELSSNTKLPGRLIPECRPDGKYAALQCHGEAVGGGRFCQCWDPEGNIIRAPSKKVKTCECLLQQHQSQSGPKRIGAYVPQCAEDGGFKKHQCHGSAGLCWCVHPTNGTQIGEKGRNVEAEHCN